jgi:hypothetical protein
MDSESFAAVQELRSLYALSAFWVHYLGTVNPDTREGFHSYLRAVGSGEIEPADARALRARLGTDPEALERDFQTWLGWLAAETSSP